MIILRRTERAMVRALCGAKRRRDDGHVLRKALEFEVKGKRKQGRPKKTWKTQVEKEIKSVSFGEGGGLESSKMESGSWRDCC